jgi:hypothetical protein
MPQAHRGRGLCSWMGGSAYTVGGIDGGRGTEKVTQGRAAEEGAWHTLDGAGRRRLQT